MGVQSLTGGNATNRIQVAADEKARKARELRDKNARGNLAAFATDRHPEAWAAEDAEDGSAVPSEIFRPFSAAKTWRDELCDILGLNGDTR